MNIEQTKEAIRVMQAFVDGKEVEALSPDKKWRRTPLPRWGWDDTEYRIKPTPTFRPWNADEVPLGAWMRKKQDLTCRWLLSMTANDAVRKDMSECSEHSTDGGVTWLPCGVMEEAK
jgi:hypothetical protein